MGWWKGDGSTLDSSGYGNNGVAVNIGYTNGIVGQAFACDPENYPYGTYNAVDVPDSPAYILTNALTIEGWIRPRGNGYFIFWRGDNRTGYDPYVLSMQNSSNLLFQITDVNNNTASVGVTLPYNQWSYVAATWAGGTNTGTMMLYVNGQLVSQTNTTIIPIGALIPGDSPGVGIGNVNDGKNNFPFTGDIDEISLYNRALTAVEIQSIYNAGKCFNCGCCQAAQNGACVAVTAISISPAGTNYLNPGGSVVFTAITTPGGGGVNWSVVPASADPGFADCGVSATFSPPSGFSGSATIYATCGTNTAWATVTMGVPPSITTQPATQTVLEGGCVTFSTEVSGIGPFTYQWQLNGTNLPNDYFIITTVAGTNGSCYFSDGGPATNASLNSPHGVAVDADGNLFIADFYNQRIRKVDTNGIITTVAGNGDWDYSGGDGDGGAATNTGLAYPEGVAVDSFGNLFIAEESQHRIRKVDTNGIITTVAGSGCGGCFGGDGGPATNACLSYPQGVAVDGFGNLFIADSYNGRIRKVDTDGIITTVAGGGNNDNDGGPATDAILRSPRGVAVDASGNLFIADAGDDRIRKVDTNGIITTVAGNGYGAYFGDGDTAADASLNWPNGVAVDGSGNVFIADTNNSVIRKVDTNGIITTFAGDGYEGYSGNGGLATIATLNLPCGVAVDTSGNVFIADTDNNLVRKVAVTSLTLCNVTADNAGNYTVIITSPYGSVTSSNAVLTVLTPPTITTQPTGQTASGGDMVTFTVVASGSPPLFYQWRFNGTTLLSGATNASLSLTNVQLAQAGGYSVLVSNAWGTTISSNAILVVRDPTVLSGSLTNYTFESDTTYYIQTTVQLYGVTTIEGGAIIKFAGQPAAQLTLNGPLVCLTGPADMAILTSKDDNSVGGTISGSTGNPGNANSGTYLSAGSGQTNDYSFLRLAYAGFGIFSSGTVNVQDSQFVQCGTAVGCGAGGTVTLINNLFYYSVIANFATNLTSTLALSNNLVFGTTVNLPQPSSPVWQAFNNDFDTCTIVNSTLTNGYNAYLNCTGRLYPTNAFDIVSASSLAYQSGALGNFYQPTNSPLIHKGSTTADQVGLYHYTVTTNQVVDGANTVSIGYHYVATDAYGNPLDANGDGIPDYLEDANGNGAVDSGEIGWNIQGDLGLKVLITRPCNNSISP